MKLPTKITVDISENEELYDEVIEFVSDYLSEKTGFCHEGFDIELKVTASNIKWDVDED